jgi:phage FluMu protein Com
VWLRCHSCERTLLVLEQQVTAPFICPRCKEENPNLVIYEPLNALPQEIVTLTQLCEWEEFYWNKITRAAEGTSSTTLTIDVTPKEKDSESGKE